MATLPSLFSGFPAVMNSSGLLFLGLPSRSGLGCPILGDSSRGTPCTHTSPVHFLFGGTIAAVTNDHRVRGLKRQDWIPSWPGGQSMKARCGQGCLLPGAQRGSLPGSPQILVRTSIPCLWCPPSRLCLTSHHRLLSPL